MMFEKEGVRQAALQALIQVEQGAFVNLELQRWLRRCSHWPAVDRGLFTDLLYGTVRWQLYLDHFLSRWSSQALDHLEKPVLLALRLGLYQIRFQDSVPKHAAVAETCEALKKSLPRAVGYVNAVLRKACAEEAWEIRAKPETTLDMAIRYSHPQWLVERWLKRWGGVETERMLERNNRTPLLWLRANGRRIDPDELARRWVARGVQFQRREDLPEAFGFSRTPLSSLQEELDEGLVSVQDLGAMLMAHTLQPQPGESILDLCAAPGGKSCHMAELMQDCGRVVALDLHPQRTALIEKQAERLGLRSVEAHCHDARRPWPTETPDRFDRVLLDAPCSGTGVLRRKVDARWRKTSEQFGMLQELQRELLQASVAAVKPGGMLLYSTCSLEAEENEANIRWLLGKYSHIALQAFPEHPAIQSLPGATQGVTTLSSVYGDSDGFFMALLKVST